MDWLNGLALKLSISGVDWACTFYDFISRLFHLSRAYPCLFRWVSAKDLKFPKKRDLRKSPWSESWFWLPWVWLDKNAPFPFFDWEQIRLGSVLGRIRNLPGFITTVLYLNFDSMKRADDRGVILLTIIMRSFLDPVSGFGSWRPEGWRNFNRLVWFGLSSQEGCCKSVSMDWNPDQPFRQICASTILVSIWRGKFFENVQPFLQKPKNWSASLNQFWSALFLAFVWIFISRIFKPIMDEFIHTLDFVECPCLFLGLFSGSSISSKFRKNGSFFFVIVGIEQFDIYMITAFVNFDITSRLLFEGLYKPFRRNLSTQLWESLGALALALVVSLFSISEKVFFKVLAEVVGCRLSVFKKNKRWTIGSRIAGP